MIRNILLASAAAVAFLAGVPAMAHHSANAEFNTQKQTTITGVLTKVENVNPHSWWYVDVTGADGKVTSWKLESDPPTGLISRGLKIKTDIKIGDTYSFRVSPAWKDPGPTSKLGWMRAITHNGKEYVNFEL
jgi:hypothetical protein